MLGFRAGAGRLVEAEVFFAAAPEVFADFETARLEAVLRPPGFLDRALAIALSLCQQDPDVPTLRLFVGVVVSPRLLLGRAVSGPPVPTGNFVPSMYIGNY